MSVWPNHGEVKEGSALDCDNAANTLLCTLITFFMEEDGRECLRNAYGIDVENPTEAPIDEAVANYYRAIKAHTDGL